MIPLDHWMVPKSGLTAKHYTTMGELMASWAGFEVVLAKCLAMFITADTKSKTDIDAAFIATVGMDARVKIGLLQSIFRYRFPDEAQEFDAWAEKVQKLKKSRDLAAHALWVPAERSGYVRAYGMTSVGKIKFLQIEYSAVDFRRFAHMISELRLDLFGFLWRSAGIGVFPAPKASDQSEEAKFLRRFLKEAGNQQSKGSQTRRRPSSRRKEPAPKTPE